MTRQVLKAKGSSLRKGGHRALHMDELPLPEARKGSNTVRNALVRCDAKSILKWQKDRGGSAEILTANGDIVITLPLSGQKAKDLKALITFLRVKAGTGLLMRHHTI